MACDLTQGRNVPCKDVVGGIQRVFFVDFGDLGTLTFGSDDELTNADGTFSAYQYNVKGTNQLTANINSSRENGTTFFEQVLELQLTKLSKEDNKELKLLAYGRPHVFVVDYNENVWFLGQQFGCEVTAGSMATGTAMGDLSGYTLTLTATERMFPSYVQGGTLADPFAGLAGATDTIVVGTNS